MNRRVGGSLCNGKGGVGIIDSRGRGDNRARDFARMYPDCDVGEKSPGSRGLAKKREGTSEDAEIDWRAKGKDEGLPAAFESKPAVDEKSRSGGEFG